jgi:hypothetical protein
LPALNSLEVHKEHEMTATTDLRSAMDRLDPQTLGRLLGLSMLLEFVFVMLSNFAWQERLLDGAGLLARAATMRPLLGSAAMVDLISSVIGIVLGVALMLRYQGIQPILTRTYVLLLAALLAAVMAEDMVLMAMGRLGTDLQSVGRLDGVDSASAEYLLRAIRAGIHLPVKLLEGFASTIFFTLLSRAGAIPRMLAIAGIGAALLQMSAVGMGVFGLPVQFALLAPLALAYPAAGLWLAWRGLAR